MTRHDKIKSLVNFLARDFCLRKKFLIGSERQERDVACTFDGDCHLTLMFGTVAGNAARKNLAAFSRETTELCRVFVVYVLNFIDAKRTNFPARASTSFSAHLQSSSVESERRVFGIDWFAAESVIVSFWRSSIAFLVRLRVTRSGVAVVGGFGIIVAA